MITNRDEIARELGHVRDLIPLQQRNLRIVEKLLADSPNNVDLHIQKSAMEAQLSALLHRQSDLEALAKNIADGSSLVVSVNVLYDFLPASVVHLYPQEGLPLLSCEIENDSPQAQEVLLTTTVHDLASPYTDQIHLDAGSRKIVRQMPVFDADRLKMITETRVVNLKSTVEFLREGKRLLLRQQDYSIHVMARNVIRWAVPRVDGSGLKFHDLTHHIGAWVTPHAGPIRQIVREVVERHPKSILTGYTAVPDKLAVRTQVKAIFDTLKHVVKLAYVNSPFAIGSSDGEIRQTVRLPSESLAERAANCIDGTVLFASIMETINLNPIIVLQTGHAFVGWEVARASGEYEFLETTMTLKASFQDAFAAGMKQYQLLRSKEWFARPVFDSAGFAIMHPLKVLRSRGIYPIIVD